MSQSTPISQLPVPMREEEDPQKMGYIQQIMDEIQEADQQQQQQSPQYYPEDDDYDNDSQQQQHKKDGEFKVINDNDNESLDDDNFTDYLWSELREPILFMVFFVLFNIPPIVYVLSKYIPWMINSQTGAATYTGLIVRGFIAGLLYWLLRHYIIG